MIRKEPVARIFFRKYFVHLMYLHIMSLQDEVHPSTCHSGIEWVSICENIFKRGSIVPEISSQTIPKLVYNIIAQRIIWSKVIIFINYQQIMNS